MSTIKVCRTVGGSCMNSGSGSGSGGSTTIINNNSSTIACRTIAEINFDATTIDANQITKKGVKVTSTVNMSLVDSTLAGPLGTPNAAFGGPGVGAGGASGSGKNETPERFLLKGDASGNIIFTFPNDVFIHSVGIINAKTGNSFKGEKLVSGAYVEAYNVVAPNLGDNSHYRKVVESNEDVRRLVVTLSDESAISYIKWKVCCPYCCEKTFTEYFDGETNPNKCGEVRLVGTVSGGNLSGNPINGFFDVPGKTRNNGMLRKVKFDGLTESSVTLFNADNEEVYEVHGDGTSDEIDILYPWAVSRFVIAGTDDVISVIYENLNIYVCPCDAEIIEDFAGYNLGSFAESVHFSTDNAVVTDTNTAGPWGAPHTDFAGPGVGAGGASGAPGENSQVEGYGLTAGMSSDGVPVDDEWSITFRHPVCIKNMRFLTRGADMTAEICGQAVPYGSIPDLGVNSFYEYTSCIPCVTKLTFNGEVILTNIKFASPSHIAENIGCNIYTENFSTFDEGEIYIKNENWTFSAANMVSNPPMIMDSNSTSDTDMASPHTDFAGPGVGAGGASGKYGQNDTALGNIVVYSLDGSSESPVAGSGVFSIAFETPVFVSRAKIINAGANATITINTTVNKVYKVPDYGANGVQEVKFNDFSRYFGFEAVKSIDFNLMGGGLAELDLCNISTTSSCRKLIVNDFSSPSPYFSHNGDLVDTNSPAIGEEAIGTPNVDFAGPGIGSGGSSGAPGENATNCGNGIKNPTAITFTDDVWLKSITFVNINDDGNYVTINGDNIYLGNFGDNSKKTINFCDVKTNSVTLVVAGLFAVVEVEFYVCLQSGNCEIVELPDNAATEVEIVGTSAKGSYMILVQPVADGASATFMASSGKTGQAGSVGAISSAASDTDEELFISYASGEKVKLFHSTLKTGGSGDLLQYKVTVFG